MLSSYVFQLSGGMSQRVMIAMALVNSPALLIADEPGASLDVSVQAQTLRLMDRLTTRRGAAVLLISHNLGVVREFADRIYVIYRGRIVEQGATAELFRDPLHPYTRALLRAAPKISEAGLPDLPEASPEFLAPRIEHPGCLEPAEGSGAMTAPLLAVDRLSKTFEVAGHRVLALDQVSLAFAAGECHAVVGESGSGKTTLANLILGLFPASSGEIRWKGQGLSARRPLAMKRAIQLVQQNPLSALNPRRSVGASIRLALDVHGLGPRGGRDARVRELLGEVGLEPAFARRSPRGLLGRTATTHRDRARARLRAGNRHSRRADVVARRSRASARPESARSSAAPTWADLHIHHPRSRGRARDRRPRQRL